MIEPNQQPLDERVPSGIAGLDDILHSGFPRGHFFLVEGEPGTGKTTLGLQFVIASARRGEKSLYVTLSETKEEIQQVARSHRWNLAGVSIFEFTPSEDSLRPEDQYSAFHSSEVEFQDTTQNILREIDRVQPACVVLDSLSEIRLLARDSIRYRRQVLALKHFFMSRNCTVLLLDDRSSGPDDLKLKSIAHGVLSLERIVRDYGKARRRIQVAKLRGSTFREGYHDYTIETGGVKVCPRLVANEHRQSQAEGTLSSGLKELDSILGGGMDRGTSTLLIGPAGAGKSTIAMSYAIAAARRGEFASLFLFEEIATLACKRAAALGMDPAPHLRDGRLAIEQVDPAELSPGEFVQHVRDAVDEKHATVIVIDSLNGYLNAMPGEHHLALQMHELLSFLNQRGVVTILVLAQAGLMGASMTSPVDLSYIADNVVLLRYFESEGRVHKALSVVKKRSGEHEDTIRKLQMRQGRITLSGPLDAFRGVLTGVPVYAGSPRELDKKDADDQRGSQS